MEKDQTITAMQRQIEELKRRAEQGSQQLQGEVQELELEALLTAKFPRDNIQPVAKGEFGGDVLQRVLGPLDQSLRHDPLGDASGRKTGAMAGWPSCAKINARPKPSWRVIISQALPKEIDTFGFHRRRLGRSTPKSRCPSRSRCARRLIEVAAARQAAKASRPRWKWSTSYLTGPRFRQRVQAIVEAFSSMKEDLDREKKAITRQWAKREEQIDRRHASDRRHVRRPPRHRRENAAGDRRA